MKGQYPPKDGTSEKVENMFQCLIGENANKLPVIIGGNKIGGDKTKDHFVIVVGYLNQGEQRSDFIIVDPFFSFPFPRAMYDFYFINDEGKAVDNSYPFPIAQRSDTYWIGNFASKEEIRDVLKNLLKTHKS